MKKPVITRITWRDAHDIGAATWTPLIKENVGLLIESIGFLVYENKHHVVITHTYTDEGSRGFFAIPKGCIVKRRDG